MFVVVQPVFAAFKYIDPALQAEGLDYYEEDSGGGNSVWLTTSGVVYTNDNVGINTTSPNADLGIDGSVTVSQDLTIDGALFTTKIGYSSMTAPNLTATNQFWVGAIQWNTSNDKVDGEQVDDDTIDEDSIDWGTGTDQVDMGDIPIGTSTVARYDQDETVDGNWTHSGHFVTSSDVRSAPRSYITGFELSYSGTTSITIKPGEGICNNNYFRITADTSHSLTSLASGQDFHYVYVDHSASSYPTPTIIDSTTEPSFSDTLQGWYNGN